MRCLVSGEQTLQRADALADVSFLERAPEERFASLKASGFDYAGLFADPRARLPESVSSVWLGIELQKLMASFTDGRADVTAC